jgi:uncharacterized membrane protein YvbJ
METIELTKLSTKIFTCGSERTGFNSDNTAETQPVDTSVEISNRSPIVTEHALVITIYILVTMYLQLHFSAS